MSCEQYENASRLREAIDPDPSERRKCEGSWSTCLESCNQSKLSSTLMSDGQCHEMKDARSSRTCHIEHCGIDDPCVIPFVVHVILGFRGVKNELWNKQAAESLIETFSSTIHNSVLDKRMFEPTDVELLMTSPWFDDVTNGDGLQTEAIASGVKAVLEVHLFNEHANMKNINDKRNNLDAGENKVRKMFGGKNLAQSGSECRNSDIFEFAQKAHEIQSNLDQSDFMIKMGRNLQKYHFSNGNGYAAAFSSFFSDERNMNESMVVSSWTIKTAVGGKGSIYDHKLDPFPGAINYVHVSSAYFGISPFTVLSVLILSVLGFNVFRRRRRRGGTNTSADISGSMSFIPKPFEMVKRKPGTSAAYTMQKTAAGLVSVRNSKTRSKLDDILSN